MSILTADDVIRLLDVPENTNKTLDMGGANLRGLDLHGQRFWNVDFNTANFTDANLRWCVFINCKFVCATFYNTNLVRAEFHNCTFEDTRMANADIRYVKFLKSDTSGIIASAGTAGFWPVCPVEGAFIGWKWADDCLVKLRIPEDARRSSGTSRKCRCDKAEVLEITHHGTHVVSARSDQDSCFVYTVGKTVQEPAYDPDRWKTCAPGIHFFMTREEAENYGLY